MNFECSFPFILANEIIIQLERELLKEARLSKIRRHIYEKHKFKQENKNHGWTQGQSKLLSIYSMLVIHQMKDI